MAVLLITYDLHRPGQAYDALIEYIKQHSWVRLSESSYVIDTSSTPQAVRDRIRALTDSNDNLYVIALSSSWSGWGPKDVNDWLSQHLG